MKNNLSLSAIAKLLLAAMLFLCLAKMPYGYYQLVRFSALLVFGYLAFESLKTGNIRDMIIYIGLALLFQPFEKIALGRQLWNLVDVIVAGGLLLSVYIGMRNK